MTAEPIKSVIPVFCHRVHPFFNTVHCHDEKVCCILHIEAFSHDFLHETHYLDHITAAVDSLDFFKILSGCCPLRWSILRQRIQIFFNINYRFVKYNFLNQLIMNSKQRNKLVWVLNKIFQLTFDNLSQYVCYLLLFSFMFYVWVYQLERK